MNLDYGNTQIGPGVVRRTRDDEGMERRKTRYGAFVRAVNRPIRVDAFTRMLDGGISLWNSWFCDECAVWLDPTTRYVTMPWKNKYGHIRPTVKYPIKVRGIERGREKYAHFR